MIRRRGESASYFLINILKPLVEAECGEVVCQCISDVQKDDILEILRFCPVAVYHNILLKSSVEKIYEKLMIAAARSSNFKHSIRLVQLLIGKNVFNVFEGRSGWPNDFELY